MIDPINFHIVQIDIKANGNIRLYLIQTLLYFANITMWRTLRERRNPYAECAMPTPHKLKYLSSIFLAPLASLSRVHPHEGQRNCLEAPRQ